MKQIGFWTVLLTVFFLAPQVSFAQSWLTEDENPPFTRFENQESGDTSGTTVGGNPPASGEGTTVGGNPSATGDGTTVGGNPSGQPGRLSNPLGDDTNSLPKFLESILDIILVFAVPVIVFFIIYGGFQLVTARGNETKISNARATITWAVVGGVIILAAELILSVIVATINAL
ncbi:pilin [Candidatus Kaiserbacteria bacterium]|nr:pilin [Candidatus Kaiserbacteria bacterium]